MNKPLQSTQILRKAQKQAFVFFISLLLCSCVQNTTKVPETPGLDTTVGNAAGTDTSGIAGTTNGVDHTSRAGLAGNASMQISSPPDPGPFNLVEAALDSEGKGEYWQARGDLGQFGGTLTVSSFGSGPKTFNPWSASDVESHGLGLLLFDPLVFTDPWTGKVIPRLAKSIEIEADEKEYLVKLHKGLQKPENSSGNDNEKKVYKIKLNEDLKLSNNPSDNKEEAKKTYIIKLRKGLKWSDGHPLNADDVMFTFNTIVKNGYGNSSLRDTLSAYGKFPDLEKVDDLTVKFRTPTPFAPFLNSLVSIGIAPKHKMEIITKKPISAFQGLWDINVNPKDMVSCGPFKLLRYVPGQRVELVRNPNYHYVDKNGRRLPYLDKMVVLIVPDQNTQILKFYGNEIDLLDIRSVRGFDAALMKQRQKTEHFSMFNLGPDDGTLFLMFNLNQRKDPKSGKFYLDPVKQKWFNNTLFRQAVNHAINRQRIVNNVLRGVGTALYTSETPASLYFNKSLQGYPQDLNYAAELLKQAGFIKKANGNLYDKDGNMVEFTLNTNSGNTSRDATCIIILEDLKKLGIKVNYQAIDFNVLINKTENSMDWEAVVMGLTGSRLEPYGGANVWKSDGRLHMFDQRLPNAKGKVVVSDARDWEKKIDSLFDQGAVELDDKKRHAIFDSYQKIAYDEVPFIYLYCQLLITAAHDKVGNYKPTPLGINYTPLGSLHNIEEIYIRGKNK